MSLQQSIESVAEHPDERKEPEMSLHGSGLLIARIAWIVLTLIILTLNIVMIPRYYAALLAHCTPGPECYAISLNVYDRLLLHQFGISRGFVAAWQVMLDAVSVLVCCALGTLIFWRKSSDRMALFCAFMLVLFGGAGYTGILQDTLAPLSTAWFVLIGTLDLLGQCSFMIFFFLFPGGRFVPYWTRWLVPCVVLYWIYNIFIYGQFSLYFWTYLVFFTLLLCIVGAQVYRYRRVSATRERQQTKWVVFGFSIGIVGFIIVLIVGNVFIPPALHQSSVIKDLVAGTLIYGFLLLIPISIAVAILRSRLYDIDVIINKALVYGSLTVLLAAAYFGLVLGLQAMFGGLLHMTNTIALVVSTVVIYALFLPLRRRIQNIIDRRFYRRKYDA
ncbi:MAG TPA: hypothetical protein VEH81_06540, partial [Ktedonobacteraceae bacterium]|nr:hypothetical protein [Ktedonobacteraceae bacterium]